MYSLTIPEVFKEDAGNFVVKATNPAGEAKCYCSLVVRKGSDAHVVKTRLVESSHTVQRTSITSTGVKHVPPGTHAYHTFVYFYFFKGNTK